MMKRLVLLSLAVLLIASNATAKKSGLRAELLNAKFVVITAYPDGGQTFGGPTRGISGRTGDDRRAMTDVERAIKEWGRWTVISSADQADLIMAVRKGRIGSIGVEKPIPPIGGGRVNTTPRYGTEVGPTEDMIAVYSAHQERQIHPTGDVNMDAPPLWRVIQANALESPSVPGIQQLRKEIEKAEAENAKKK
jgi:hypothetical protein